MKLNPDFKLIAEPYGIYENWIGTVPPELAEKMERLGRGGYKFDFLMQEKSGDAFVSDPRVAGAGYGPDRVASSTPNISDTERMLAESSAAAARGAWTMWYGRAGGTINAPNYKFIREIPARLKLLKAVPTWENLNGTPCRSAGTTPKKCLTTARRRTWERIASGESIRATTKCL